MNEIAVLRVREDDKSTYDVSLIQLDIGIKVQIRFPVVLLFEVVDGNASRSPLAHPLPDLLFKKAVFRTSLSLQSLEGPIEIPLHADRINCIFMVRCFVSRRDRFQSHRLQFLQQVRIQQLAIVLPVAHAALLGERLIFCRLVPLHHARVASQLDDVPSSAALVIITVGTFWTEPAVEPSLLLCQGWPSAPVLISTDNLHLQRRTFGRDLCLQEQFEMLLEAF
mmetsp:Transcript_36458/g.67126  ORF Transcript_36458/g.67126 Transcript_36458/m.67126 type:complete len:223 (+) Transcript_36458:2371-3039(+)